MPGRINRQMRDVELYRHLIGIEPPWTVTRVELQPAERQVDVWVDHKPGIGFPCSDCQAESPVHDHSDERIWRHLDSCHFKTLVHARIPRVNCSEHGVRQARVPWAEPHSRFTLLFERLAIDVLKECDVLGTARLLDLSWDEAWGILHRAVQRGLARKTREICPRLGIDEKAIAKGHRYFTLVCNIDRGTVEYVAEDRKRESLDPYFQSLTPQQLGGIEGVAMDMWEPYILSTLAHVPAAKDKIVFDRYHVMAHVGKAVDDVRKREHRELLAVGDDFLKGSKYLWLYGQENVPAKHQDRFAELRAANLKTGRAWAIKESLRELWTYFKRGWAEKFWKRWYFWATHSRLEPVKKAANLIKRHINNILTYCEHRITNATSEGLNSKIQTVKKMAYGFRSKENFKAAIYFHCGGLSLYPTHEISG